ncbi:hypothetical protein MCEZEM1_00761 [Comamonadaceae bacterium]
MQNFLKNLCESSSLLHRAVERTSSHGRWVKGSLKQLGNLSLLRTGLAAAL